MLRAGRVTPHSRFICRYRRNLVSHWKQRFIGNNRYRTIKTTMIITIDLAAKELNYE
ncbi:hypothetical protein GL179_05990 [Vibrio toranzoniae]|nr:hypothetical protein [Vibrio toranzoniae]